MVSTRIAVKTFDAGQTDIRNMFNGKNDQDNHQESDQMVENQARNCHEQQDCITKLTLLSKKSKKKDTTQEQENKG